jgi:hypothetical protein
VGLFGGSTKARIPNPLTARKIKARQFQQSLFPRKQQSIPAASIPSKSEDRASWDLPGIGLVLVLT